MRLIEASKASATDEECLAYLGGESRRWPDGVRCPVRPADFHNNKKFLADCIHW